MIKGGPVCTVGYLNPEHPLDRAMLIPSARMSGCTATGGALVPAPAMLSKAPLQSSLVSRSKRIATSRMHFRKSAVSIR